MNTNMNTINLNEELIIRMAAGDKNAFSDLYRQTASAVFGFALSMLRNRQDAEDVMHDAYIKIYRGSGAYRPRGKPMAWILTIVRNLCYTRLKAGRICEDISQYDHLSLEEETGAAIDRLVLQKALDILAYEDRQIVILHALTGMKHREIAELLDMPLGTVLAKYKRALSRLRKELEKGGNVS